MNALEILNHYLYAQPEFELPLPGHEAAAHLEATEHLPELDISVDSQGTTRLGVTVDVPSMLQVLALAKRELVASADGDPMDLDHMEQLRAQMGADAFNLQVSSMARSFFTSAAILRSRVFPLVAPAPAQSDVLDAANLTQPYHYELSYIAQPRAQVLTAGPLDIKIPDKPAMTDELVDRQVRVILRGRNISQPLEEVRLPVEGSPALEHLQALAKSQLAEKLNTQWSDEVLRRCNAATAERVLTEPPAAAVELYARQLEAEFRLRIEQTGLAWEQYCSSGNFDADAFAADMQAQARQTLRTGMGLDAFAQAMGVVLTKRDIWDSLGEAGQDPATAAPLIMMSGQLPEIVLLALRYKTGDVLARRVLKRHSQAQEQA